MAKAQDIKLGDDNDLFIDETGDFVFADSDTRHVDDIIDSYVGQWREFPAVGVGVKRKQSQSGSIQIVSREIRVQLVADGYTVSGIKFDNSGGVYVTGKRKKENF